MTRDPEANEKTATKPVKRRKWPKLLLVLALVFLAMLPVLNGPGFRLLVHWQLNSQLENIGFIGDTEVRGTFLSGVELRNFKWEHGETETAFAGSDVLVKYDLRAYFDEGIMAVLQEVRASNSKITLDLREPPPEDPDAEGLKLEKLPQPRIYLRSISATILLPDEETLKVEGLDLTLVPGEDGRISINNLTLPNGWEREGILAGVGYTDTGWVLSDLKLVDDVVIERAEAVMVPGAPVTWQVNSDLKLWNASMFVEWKQDESLAIALKEGVLDFDDVLVLLGQDLPLIGEASEVDVQIAMNGSSNYRDWSGPVSLRLAGVVYDDLPVGSVEGAIQFDQGKINLQSLRIFSGGNEILVSGSTELPADGAGFETMEGNANLRFSVRDNVETEIYLSRFAPEAELSEIDGEITAAWRNERVEDLAASLRAEQLSWGGWSIQSVEIGALSRPDILDWIDLEMVTQIDGENSLRLNLAANQENLEYQGEAQIDLSSLSTFEMPLEVAMMPERVRLDWTGRGSFQNLLNAEGEASLSVVLPAREPNQPLPTLDGRILYDPEKVEIVSLLGTWGEHSAELAGMLTPEGLELSKIQVYKGSLELVSGSARVPLTDADELMDRFWEAEEDLEVRLDTQMLDLADLTQGMGLEEPPQGTVEAHVSLSGRPSNMGGSVSISARQVGLASKEALAGYLDGDIAISLANHLITLDGSLKQERLPALVLKGSMPFDPLNWEAARQAPIQGSLSLPEADLSFLPEFVPAITGLRGVASAQMSLSGTVAKPIIAGSIRINASQVDFEKNTIPQITNLNIVLLGQEQEIVLSECRATIAAGGLNASGRVSLENGLEDPDLNFSAEFSKLPLVRNESMIVRTNGSVQVNGSLAEANITGRLGITESRYYQEFQILPTEIPRRSSAAPSAGIQRTYGVQLPPLNNWNVDLLVQSDEPFFVRTNLLAANVTMDLRIRGKLGAVYPEGEVVIADAFGQLPFSEVDFDRSTIQFDQRTGFIGNLNIRGVSEMENYRVNLRVRGTLDSPEPVFTSNPPLPEEEIYTLLATGTTREELLGNKNVAATKAVVLVFDQLWRRFVDENWKGPKEMREKRLTVQADRVNARTGRNMTGARLRLTDRIFISGEADVEGDFRGLLHYIFKF